ncbi:sialate O-acetylesterase [Pedobacter rhizosphaerae]|uniref:Sialate O-acetylesterase n=1 Tax=Pedobacter rhizosphaerae TaxID=390241 RepID=A0A1H9QZ39_9SPHI|nr:sialate O-acetylesterase [Pedobacter rhizosphaerae]SER65726.1 sialate O-acetylesterase [Pedobacter rhizosphaerae]
MNLKSAAIIIVATFLLNSFNLSAKITLPAALGSNMVLQQKTKVTLWGKATPAKNVTVKCSWNKLSYAVKSNAVGKWEIKVATPAYGGPYTITISDGEVLTLNNVMIGEVWFCSGQSNMEMPLARWGKVNNYEEEIRQANYPNIRLLQVNHVTADLPIEEASISSGGWQNCSPNTISEFSSTAYFFAREVYKNTGIPIGLIHASWGGTIAEAWTSAQTLKTLPDFKAETERIQTEALLNKNVDKEKLQENWEKKVRESDLGFSGGKYTWTTDATEKDWSRMTVPALWEDTALPGFDGIVYLKRKIVIIEQPKEDAKLSLAQIDDNDMTFLDGKLIGETVGYNQNRKYKIPAASLTPGEHLLVVRVMDSGGGGGIYGEKSQVFLDLGNAGKIDLSGDWLYRVALDLKKVGPSPSSNQTANRPTVLFNAMVNPFLKYTIKGAIWYQGESNAERAAQYRTLFPSLIKDWRRHWNIGDFPFLFVQLANFKAKTSTPGDSQWAELRDAQLNTLALPNTGMAVTIDIGDSQDIHPKNKQEVGKRLALIALAKVYGKHIAYSGPQYSSMKVVNQSVELSFNFAEQLKSTGKSLTGFSIAGQDRKFYWADAKIIGDKIIVSAPDVPHPVAVRYGWADNPEANLTNKSGLPATPFRTDDN